MALTIHNLGVYPHVSTYHEILVPSDASQTPMPIVIGAVHSETQTANGDPSERSTLETTQNEDEPTERDVIYQIEGRYLSKVIQWSFLRTGYQFTEPSGRGLYWTGSMVRPFWIPSAEVDSSAMLGAFLEFVRRFSRAPVEVYLPFSIVVHSSNQSCVPTTMSGLLDPIWCMEPMCTRCRRGLGGYQFRWSADEWIGAYRDTLGRDKHPYPR